MRPEEKNGRVRLTCNVSVGVRDAMETAKYSLGMDFSEMVNVGVSMLLESMGQRVGPGSGSRGPAGLGPGQRPGQGPERRP